MIKKEERDHLSEVIRRYIDEGITVFIHCRRCNIPLRYMEDKGQKTGYFCPNCGKEWPWQ